MSYDRPSKIVDVVIDTDTFNEIDDQWAVSYALKSPDRLNVLALCAAPFQNDKVSSYEEGMLKSYEEICRILDRIEPHVDVPVFHGSATRLKDKFNGVRSDAAFELVRLAKEHSMDNPLYVVGIGGLTDIASALLIDPSIADSIIIVWLGGHTEDFPESIEFNMKQDLLASRIVFDSDAQLVQIPCRNVAEICKISKPELEHHFLGKNSLCDFLVSRTVDEGSRMNPGDVIWTRTLWDVTAICWLLDDRKEVILDKMLPRPSIDDVFSYVKGKDARYYLRARFVDRDLLFRDLKRRLTQ